MQRIVFKVQHGSADKENCLNMLPNTIPMCLSAALVKVRVHSSEKFTLLKSTLF